MRLSKMVGAVLVSTMLCAAPVGAQPVDDQMRATARALADEGMTFFEQKKYAEALDRFDRAITIIQAPTITLHAARSLDKLGRLIEAAERYRACINTPVDDKSPGAFRAAQEDARSELQALTPRIPSIEIAVEGPGAADAIVTLDGKPVPKALIGVKTLVNPGEHKVGAMTETHADLADVSITEKQSSRVVLQLTPKSDANTGQTVPPVKQEKTPINGKKVGGVVMLGLGGALGIVGVVAGVSALNQKTALADDGCPSGGTPREGADCTSETFLGRVADFQTARNVSVATLAIGGAAVVTGVVLVVLGSKAKPAAATPTTTSLHIEPWIGIGSAGLHGTF